MRKKHPIRRFFTVLLVIALVAGLAALPMLTKNAAQEENAASILSGTAERRELVRSLISGAPLETVEPVEITVPYGVKVLKYLVASGEQVSAGDVIALVDDVSVMTAVKAVQETLDSLSKSLQTARSKIIPGVISVDDGGNLCVDGKKIADDKLTYYAEFLSLSQQHREYEEIMLKLFQLHTSGTVTAPCDGLVGKLDDTLVWQLSSDGGWELVFLSAEEKPTEPPSEKPGQTPEERPVEIPEGEGITCFLRGIVSINEDGTWVTRKSPEPFTIASLTDLAGINRNLSEETETIQPDSPVMALEGLAWAVIQPEAGDLLLYADDGRDGCWILKVGTIPVEEEPEKPTGEEDKPGQGGNRPTGGGGIGGGITQDMINSYLAGLGGNRGGFGGNRGMTAGSGKESELYSTASSTLCTVTPMDTMQLTLSVDEMDIAALALGMTAQVKLEALPNQEFTAEITEISKFGTNNGGSSKFDVTLELPCAENMLPGMNASVTLKLETYSDCLTIPVAALVEQGTKTVIFTDYDEEAKALLNPIELTLGYSDGEYVQVLSGLNDHSSFRYSYYDQVEISNAVEKKNAGLFG